MKPGKAIILLLLIPACLTLATWGLSGRPWGLLILSIGIQLAIFIAKCGNAKWMDNEAHAWSIGRVYRPRPTDAGRWVDAPIAEIDKSTVGKLLASRMRRDPGLQVVVRGRTAESHPASSDGLYDPELDG